MNINPDTLIAVEQKLSRQNALLPALIMPFWCVIVIILWYVAYQYNDDIAPLFLCVSGVILGLLVRLHGKGYTKLFSVIGFLSHLLVTAAAVSLNIFLGVNETVWAVILVGLYVFGACGAVILARRHIPFEQHNAFFKLTEMEQHSSIKETKNRWFVALPCFIALALVLMYIVIVNIFMFDIGKKHLEHENKIQQRQQAFENIAIEVDKSSLDKLSNREALRHAYAFYSGSLVNAEGRPYKNYPRSTYKAKTILNYLVRERNNARAKIILYVIEDNTARFKYVSEAAEQGDIYAKIESARLFGCNGGEALAPKTLQRLQKQARNKNVKWHIHRILYDGFPATCEDETLNYFSVYHVTTPE